MSRADLHTRIKEIVEAHHAHGSQPEYIADAIMSAIDEYIDENADPEEAWKYLKEGDRVRVREKPDCVGEDGIYRREWGGKIESRTWEDLHPGKTGKFVKDDGDFIPWVKWDDGREYARCIMQFKLEKISDEPGGHL